MDRWAAILGNYQEGKTFDLCPVTFPAVSSRSDALFILCTHPPQVDSAREVCLVQFEDDSQFLVLWKDISPGETLEAWECASHGRQEPAHGTGPDTVFPRSCPPWGGAPLLCLSLRGCGPWEPAGQL